MDMNIAKAIKLRIGLVICLHAHSGQNGVNGVHVVLRVGMV